MLDLIPALAAWPPAASGRRCAVATVLGTGGSVPRPVGMADGGPSREFFGYSTEEAFAVGLTCGGELEVHIELLADALGPLGLEVLNILNPDHQKPEHSAPHHQETPWT